MKKNYHYKKQNTNVIMEELEARVLFSGGLEGILVNEMEPDVATYIDINSTDSSSTQDEAASVTAAEQQTQELVFVDSGVDNYQVLLDDLLNNADNSRNFEVILLNENQNGIDLISQTLQGRDDLDAIHIISHGEDGSIELGNTSLNADSLSENNLAIAMWANSFSETGDILIYGCNLAETELGKSLVNNLSELTLADVAASDDLTGHERLGGDWDLEYHAGEIDVGVAPSAGLQATYQHVLDVINGTTGNDTLNGTAGDDVISGDAGNDVLVSGGGNDQMLGEADDDIFRFTGAQDGDVITVDGGTGTDTIDLTGYNIADAVFADGQVTIDTGPGFSFQMDYSNIDSIQFADTTATVITGDISASSFSGSVTYIEGDAAFTIEHAAGGTIDWSYVAATNSLSISDTDGTSASSNIMITSHEGSNFSIDAIASDGVVGSLTTNVNIGQITFSSADNTRIDNITVSNGTGYIGSITHNGDMAIGGTVTIDANVDTFALGAGKDIDSGTFLITGDLRTLDVPNFAGGTVIAERVIGQFDSVADSPYSNNFATPTKVTINGSISTEAAPNSVPVITSDGGNATASINVFENNTTVTTVTATDADLDTLAYSIDPASDDVGFFSIDAGGVLSFITAPDFETAADLNGDNVYEVTIKVDDGNGGVDTQAISVTVTDSTETYIVSSTADSGVGSLRQAILDANANSGMTDIINFDITGAGPHTISLLSALPSISDTVNINGWSEPDFGSTPVIRIDGTSAGFVNGLTFSDGSDGSSVSGLMITNFEDNGIQIDSGADGITIQGNWIGTTGTGSSGVGNTDNGINVRGANTIIGGTGVNEGNVITNNGDEGIDINGTGATGTIIQGNIIGLDPDGSSGSGNADVGIAVLAGAHNTTIGGITPEARNIISNNYEGIEINSNNNTIQGNYIGTDITGTLDRGNRSDDGIEIQNNATGNLIGGADPGAGNLIAFNALDGVNIVNGSNNTLLGNQIHSNGDLDVDLGAGANSNQNEPVLATATATGSQLTITGTLTSTANSYFRIEFFGANNVFLDSADVATDGSGNATINETLNISVANGEAITATATKSELTYTSFFETSEMAAGINVTSINNVPTVTNSTITATEDVTYVLTATDFGYSDPDSDPINKVQITKLPTVGTFELNGVAVTLNQEISKADIDLGLLTFKAADNASGNGYDSFEYRVHDGMEYSNAVTSTSYINSTFDADAEGFTYADISDNASWASGSYDAAGGVSGGGLRIDLAGGITGGESSGAWSDTFTLTETTDIIVSTDFRLLMSEMYEATEYGELFLKIDGVAYGNDTSSSLIHTIGDGNGGAVHDSGWLSYETTITLGAGTHTLELSAVNNDATAADEYLEAYFDNVSVTAGVFNTMTVDVDAVNDAPSFDTGSFDISSASLAESLSVGSEDGLPYGLSFSPDGTMMYMLGNSSDTIYGYSLPAPFQLDVDGTSATHTQTLSVGSEEVTPLDFEFNNDGSKLYIIGNTDDAVVEYALSSAFDLNTATHSGALEEFSVAAQTGSPQTLTFNDDGTKLFISNSNDDVFGYDLSVAFDVSTAAYSGETKALSGVTGIRDIQFNADGSKLFAVDSGLATIFEYDLNTGFDVTTAVYAGIGETLDVSGAAANPRAMAFSQDGSRLFVADSTADAVIAYDLATISSLASTTSFTEDGTPVVLDSDATIFDAELSATDSFDGSTLTLIRNGGANSEDVYSETGALGVLTEGGNLVVQSVNIGTVTTNSAGALVLTFNSSATNSLVNSAMQQIAYSNSSDAPPTSVQIDWAFNDGNTGSQGSGGALQTVGSTTINITAINDAAIIAGTDTGSVQEDVSVVANNITTTGTLTITDDDVGEASFQSGTIVGSYGSLVMQTNGNWSYTADNTQAAIQQLDVGESVTDTLTVTAFDGTTHNVVLTINGTDDAAVIGGTTTGSVTEDGTQTASGTLTITDTDSSDPTDFVDTTAAGDNGFGNFVLVSNTWTYTLSNNHASVQALDVGETLTDTVTFTAPDGVSQQVTVTINGAEDTPLFDSTAVTSATEDSAYSYSITTSDVDVESVTITASTLPAWLTLTDNGDGTATLSGTPTNAEVGNHSVVLNVDDGEVSSNQSFTIAVANTNDAAIIAGTDTGSVQEDVSVVANNITTTGTLTITDDDVGEASFQSGTIVGSYGSLVMQTNGNWSYTADNTQAAIQQLDVGESVTDTLTVTAFDGTTHNVVLTINGTDDAAVIGGTTTGSVTEDGTQTASGTLTITDTDSSDPTDFVDTTAAGDNGFGNFVLVSNTWTYTLSNNHASVQALDVGETLTDTVTFTAPDGVSQQVTVTINGAEDTPLFDSTAVTSATEDSAYSYSITTSDVDIESVTITASTLPAWLTLTDNGDGTATLSGTPTNAEVGNHSVVLNVDDGEVSSNQSFTIAVANTNDAAIIAGTDTGSVQEDVSVVANNITTTGTLTITDDDVGEASFQSGTIVGSYGSLVMQTNGNWSYTADNTQAAIQQLDVGESVTDTLTVTAFDGTTHNVVLTINGTDDAAVIGGTTTGSVTEDGTQTASGTLTITDTDSSDPTDFVDTTAAGDNGFGNFVLVSNTWTYTLSNNHASVQALDVGETLTDTVTFTAPDGVSQQVTVTINGAEDTPLFDSTAVTSATEDSAYSYSITTSDVDIESVTITASTLPAWLTLTDNGDGTATLSGTPTNAEVGNHSVVLNVDDGEVSSNQSFTIAVANTNDAAIIAGTDTGSVQEDVSVVANNITTTGTLTITDDDVGEASFQSGTIVGSYGSLVMQTNGNWSYTADNTQAAIQQLDVGESVTDTLTVTAFDGTTHNVVLTINGTDDAAVIGGTTTGSVTEDGTQTASGTLTITDTDSSDPTDFVDTTAAGDNGFGNFVLVSNTWTYTLSNNHASVQALDVGETLTDTVTFTAPDGVSQQVTVTINGAEDTPLFDSTAVTSATEDSAYSYSITTSDVDIESVTITASTLPAWLTLTDNGDGTATLSGTPTNAEVGNHSVVLNVDDGEVSSNQSFTIAVANTNDAAIIAGTDTGSVQEDVSVVANNITTTGTLTITDDDVGEASFQSGTIVGSYGSLVMQTNGNWSYTADNTQAAIQQLDVGESVTDTLTVTAFDGTTHNVVLTINGTDDAAVIGGTTTGSVTEDGTQTASGTLTITDTDSSDPTDFVDTTAAGDNGFGNFVLVSNTWTYTLSNNHASVQALDVGETLTDTVTFTAPDGVSQQVTVTINGAEDTPLFDSTAVTSATEDSAYSYSITTSDVDIESVTITASTLPAWLTLTDNGDGTATLSGTPTNAEVGNHSVVLNVDDGEVSSNQSFTIAVANTNDAAIIAGTDTGSVQEDVSVVANNITTTGTLTITDDDVGEASFQSGTIVGSYGSLVMQTNGNWSYTADNTQAAIQQLDVGESVTDTLTVTAFDGTTHNVVLTINGTDDAAVIGGTTTGSVTEDGTQTASGTLTITDTDSSDPTDFVDTTAAGDNGFGNFVLVSNTWTYTLSNNHASVQALDVGETLTDTVTFTAPDGVSQQVTVTINGAEDTPLFDSTAVTSATEDSAYSYSITTSDVDIESVTITASTLPAWLTLTDNGDGTATLSGTPTNAEVGNHSVVLNVDDGEVSSNQSFTIAVANTNDAAIIAGTDTGSVQEDVSVVANNITTTGTLTITDDDVGEASFQSGTIVGSYGSLVMQTNGNWSYTADNTQAAIQQLDVGESVTDTLTVTAFDGTTHNVVLTINGTDDAAVIGGTTTGSVTEDGTQTASGTLTITDTDSSDPTDFVDTTAAGDNGFGNFVLVSNTWTYTLSNNHASVQALDVGETLTDTVTFTAPDGVSQQVTVTINGAEDTPLFDSTAVTSATEDSAYSYSITTSDVDVESVTITASTLPAWLTLTDNGDGTATLSGTPTNAEVGNHSVVLNVDDGEVSSNQSFTIAVANTNDAAIIAGTDTGSVQEDVSVVANNITTTGTLTITDDDVGEASFQSGTIVGSYGSLVMQTNGNWSYTADNTQAAIQQLDVGESVTDTLTVTAFDGTTHNVVLTLNGTDFDNVPVSLVVPVQNSIIDETAVREQIKEPDTTQSNSAASIVNEEDIEAIIETRSDSESEEQTDQSANNLEEQIESLIDTNITTKAGVPVDPDGVKFSPEQAEIKNAEFNVNPREQLENTQQLLRLQALNDQLSNQATVNIDLNSDFELDQQALKLFDHIDQMQKQMGEDASESAEEIEVETQVVLGTTVSLTAGFVSWALRGGTLLASLMSSIPLLNRFDPLPILKAHSNDNIQNNKKPEISKVPEKSDSGNEQTGEIEELFKHIDTDENK